MPLSSVPLDLTALRAAYAGGLDPRAVIDAVLAATDAADDPGIYIARADRAALHAQIAALPPFDAEKYPLWGVPCAVKDNIDVAGFATTAACPSYSYYPETDAQAVARLRAAGAIIIGKTNLDQFATGLVGVRSPYPPPRNAIDPDLVPGGSSSGSAVAVARGLVSFALGTDTAGSGRVPAGLNNIVGLKPSLGAVSTAGVVPACRSLDCVSVFARSTDDAFAVFAVLAAGDPPPRIIAPPARPVIGVPRPEDLRFFGDDAAAAAWDAACARMVAALNATLVEIDLTPFFATAALLYDGPWVAERLDACADLLARDPAALHPVTAQVIGGGHRYSALDAFRGQYRLAELRAACAPVWAGIDALAVPTAPLAPTLADLAADPLTPNMRLGTYTNFVNLLDLAALSVPGPFRVDGRAAGLTLIGPRGRDGALAGLGRLVHQATGGTIGATGDALPPLSPLPAPLPPGLDAGIEIAVVGAHLSGLPLNPQLTGQGGVLVATGRTAPCYRFYALPGGPPRRPGLVRVAEGGVAIDLEIWRLPPLAFARFVAAIPAPLGIGTLALADGGSVLGFLCEAAATAEAEDISHHGGWRAWLAAQATGEAAA